MRAFTQGDTLGRMLTYCECDIDHNDSENYVDIHLFKYPRIPQLLEESNEKGAPKGAFDSWVTGKLFGYSDIKIARFLREKGSVNAGSR